MNIGSILPDSDERVSITPSTLGLSVDWYKRGRIGAVLTVYVRPGTHVDLAVALLRWADGINGRPTVAEVLQAALVKEPDTYDAVRLKVSEMERELLGEDGFMIEEPTTAETLSVITPGHGS